MKIGISIVRKENITIFIFHLSFLANQAVTRKIQRFKKKKKRKKHTRYENSRKERKKTRTCVFMNLKALINKYRFSLRIMYIIRDPIRNPLVVIDEFHSFTMLLARRSFHVMKLKRNIKSVTKQST